MAKLSTEELLERSRSSRSSSSPSSSRRSRRPSRSPPRPPSPLPAVPPPAAAAEEVEEQTAFDVVLEAAGEKKIQVIKVVRELTSLGLGEAKAVVDGAPKAVLEGATKEAADKAKAALEEAGATVTLK